MYLSFNHNYGSNYHHEFYKEGHKKITIREGLKVNVVFGFLNGPI
jgi:hypothetical protein